MVQRKVANKLGIQADHVKSEKRLANLKTSSSHQHQDGRNRGGTELKKKMKKSRSIKLSDIESLRSPSPPLKQNIPQPGKPPPQDVPQKQSMVKTPALSPNYMKSTSSFEARKEHIQVSSSKNTPTGSGSKNLSRKNTKNSKLDSTSGHKSARTLTKTPSFKLGRTLTKTPSFKLSRSSVKKCSQVALCADINAHRATCSSTLKDSKFPAYLTLNPGGTEYEGTSVMKVCPYTYCSLNGHCHAPLPPLKCFLSARRRLMKTQKSMKLEALFPLKANLSGDRRKEIDTEQVISDKKPAQEEDLGRSFLSPLVKEGSMEFFIEIYAGDKEDTAETAGCGTDNWDDEKIRDFAQKMDDLNCIVSSAGGDNETAVDHGSGKVAESPCDGSPHSEIDFEDSLDQNTDNTSAEMDSMENFPEEQMIEDADEDCPAPLAHEETILGYSCNGSDWEGECSARIELEDESYFEASDMEWEEGQFSTSHLDKDADDTTQTDDESDLNDGNLSEIENPDLHDESIFKSDDTVSYCFQEILADEVVQEICEEKGASFEAKLGEEDSESDGTHQNLENDESSKASGSKSHEQQSSTEDALKELSTAEEKERTTETDDLTSLLTASASTEEPIEEPMAASEEKEGVCEAGNTIIDTDSQLEHDDTSCTRDVADEALIDQQENDFSQDDDTNVLLGSPITDSSQDFTENDQDVTNEDYGYGPKIIKAFQFDAATEKCTLDEEVIDERFLPEIEDSEMAQNVATSAFDQEQQLPNTDAGDGVEKSQVDDAKSLVRIHIPDSSHGCSEAEQENIEDNNESCTMMELCHDAAIAEDSGLSRDLVDGSLPSETQYHAYDEKFQISIVVENQNHEAARLKSSSSMDSEENNDTEMNKCTLTESSAAEVEKMEVEGNTELDAANTCLTANNLTSPETQNSFFHAEIDTNQELHNACNNMKGKIRSKKPVKDWEEPRKFNPRDPNYLSVEPDPEAEQVDLRHQMMDERKNAEEWMVDYALRKAVTKLAPARKRRVALLVEAFETVAPIPKYETHLRRSSAAFAHVRPIQACS